MRWFSKIALLVLVGCGTTADPGAGPGADGGAGDAAGRTDAPTVDRSSQDGAARSAEHLLAPDAVDLEAVHADGRFYIAYTAVDGQQWTLRWATVDETGTVSLAAMPTALPFARPEALKIVPIGKDFFVFARIEDGLMGWQIDANGTLLADQTNITSIPNAHYAVAPLAGGGFMVARHDGDTLDTVLLDDELMAQSPVTVATSASAPLRGICLSRHDGQQWLVHSEAGKVFHTKLDGAGAPAEAGVTLRDGPATIFGLQCVSIDTERALIGAFFEAANQISVVEAAVIKAGQTEWPFKTVTPPNRFESTNFSVGVFDGQGIVAWEDDASAYRLPQASVVRFSLADGAELSRSLNISDPRFRSKEVTLATSDTEGLLLYRTEANGKRELRYRKLSEL